MLHGFNFLKLALLSTLVLCIQMPVNLNFFNTRDLYCKCAVHTIKLIVTWLVPNRAIKENYKKIER